MLLAPNVIPQEFTNIKKNASKIFHEPIGEPYPAKALPAVISTINAQIEKRTYFFCDDSETSEFFKNFFILKTSKFFLFLDFLNWHRVE